MSTTEELDLDHLVDVYRRELTGYCYRMLGAGAEAEDAVQETILRAWRAADRFEGRSSARTWLYRIAHNVCVDMVRSPQRRALPVELGPSSATRDVVLGEPLAEDTWVEPMLDAHVVPETTDPAELAVARESVRLAFVAALQHLPARQRAALILCDVLRWPAAETAQLLDTSVASVNSALQRARATLEERRGEHLDPIDDPVHTEVLSRYVDAFERYDTEALAAMMRADVVLTMPPFDVWLRSPAELVAWFLGPGIGCSGSRLVPVEVNGTAGFGSYKPAGPGRWEPFAIQLIEVRDGAISGHHNYLYPHWFERFGLPDHLGD